MVRYSADSKAIWLYVECLDLFEIDGQQIMTCCPQGVESEGDMITRMCTSVDIFR